MVHNMKLTLPKGKYVYNLLTEVRITYTTIILQRLVYKIVYRFIFNTNEFKVE